MPHKAGRRNFTGSAIKRYKYNRENGTSSVIPFRCRSCSEEHCDGEWSTQCLAYSSKPPLEAHSVFGLASQNASQAIPMAWGDWVEAAASCNTRAQSGKIYWKHGTLWTHVQSPTRTVNFIYACIDFHKNEKKWENTQARSRSWISYHLSTNRLAGQNASQAIPMTWSLRFISPYAGHLFQCCARPLQKTAKTVHLLLFTPSDACNINACTEMPWMRYNRNSTLTDDRCFTTKLLPKIRKLSLASSTGSMEHCPTCTVNAIHAFSASYKHSAMTD
jgi:hypothetical protein